MSYYVECATAHNERRHEALIKSRTILYFHALGGV